MQLQKIVIFSLYHVIVRPTKIIKDLSKGRRQHLCTGFTEVLNNFGRSDDDFLYLHMWFYAQLAQKILNGIQHTQYVYFPFFKSFIIIQIKYNLHLQFNSNNWNCVFAPICNFLFKTNTNCFTRVFKIHTQNICVQGLAKNYVREHITSCTGYSF